MYFNEDHTIRATSFKGKDGREWTSIVFIDEEHVFQWFGSYADCPIDMYTYYSILSSVANGKYGVVNIVADGGAPIPIFCNKII